MLRGGMARPTNEWDSMVFRTQGAGPESRTGIVSSVRPLAEVPTVQIEVKPEPNTNRLERILKD